MDNSVDYGKLLSLSLEATSTKNSTSWEATLDDHMKKIEEMAKDSEAVKGINKVGIQDSYNNALTGTGHFNQQESFTNYGLDNNTNNWALWTTLYNDSWVFRRAIDKPAVDSVTAGFTLFGDEDYTPIYKAFNKVKDDIIYLLQMGALYGGAVAVVLLSEVSDEEMSKPISEDKLKSSTIKLYITDRWYGVGVVDRETVTDMNNIDYGKPKYYNITFADGHSVLVHHSYVIRYEHRNAPKLIKNGMLMGWGYAEGSHILNELTRDDQLKSAIQTLVNKSCIEVIQMAGMRGVFMGADEKNAAQLQKRLEMVNWGRSYNSLTFLDKDDVYTMNGFSGLTGLSDILQQNMWLIAAALEMEGILYGDLKGGLAQETDAFKRYSKTIMSRSNTFLRPVLKKLLKIFFIKYDIEGTIDFEFNSLDSVDENNKRVSDIQSYATTLNSLVTNGIISKYQMAKSLQTFMQKNVITITFTDEQLNKLKFEEEQELIKLYEKYGAQAPQNQNEFSGNEGFGGEGDFGGSSFGNEDELGGDEEFGNDFSEESGDIDFSATENDLGGEEINGEGTE